MRNGSGNGVDRTDTDTNSTTVASAPPTMIAPPKSVAPPKPSKPKEPDTFHEPCIRDPAFCYALDGPRGWHVALVEKEPFPDAYVLTIRKAGDRGDILYRDTFATWCGQLRDDDQVYTGFQELLGAAIKATTGSNQGWTVVLRALTTDEIIDLDTDGELRRLGGCGDGFSGLY